MSDKLTRERMHSCPVCCVGKMVHGASGIALEPHIDLLTQTAFYVNPAKGETLAGALLTSRIAFGIAYPDEQHEFTRIREERLK